jgi:hypothetical protein
VYDIALPFCWFVVSDRSRPGRPPDTPLRTAGDAGDGARVVFVERFALEQRLGKMIELLALVGERALRLLRALGEDSSELRGREGVEGHVRFPGDRARQQRLIRPKLPAPQHAVGDWGGACRLLGHGRVASTGLVG